MVIGSLFSGIGGIDLGLQRAGMEVGWQVEFDPWCRRMLAKHWPDVPRFVDVKEVGAHNLPPVDMLAGGFPCQDISNAGKRAGIQAERSGLWFEFARIIRELRPRYVLVENVGALLVRGMDAVLGELSASGYDAEWECIPAAAVGAPHIRDRVWIVAYPQGGRFQGGSIGQRLHEETSVKRTGQPSRGNTGEPETLAYPNGQGLEGSRAGQNTKWQTTNGHIGPGCPASDGHWATEPDVGRVADGVPQRVDRLKGLGNAVVPQVVEYIGRQILNKEETCQTKTSGVTEG
jgi:DNA (cytosine-5)-methyltransferase 1